MSQWEGERRRGRPPVGDEPTEMRITIRVTREQFRALQRAARDNQHEHLATYLRELIDVGVLESQTEPVFSRAS